MEEVFKTSDLGLASFLSLHYTVLRMDEDKDRPGKKFFIFEHSEGLKGMVEDYWNNKATVNPSVYYLTIKLLKNRILGE